MGNYGGLPKRASKKVPPLTMHQKARDANKPAVYLVKQRFTIANVYPQRLLRHTAHYGQTLNVGGNKDRAQDAQRRGVDQYTVKHDASKRR